MNVVDSSGWIEYLSGGPNAAFFRDPIEDEEALLVPTLNLTIIDLDDRVALDAAELSVVTGLALADSIMLATARAHRALFWTQDADFDGLEGVRLKRKS